MQKHPTEIVDISAIRRGRRKLSSVDVCTCDLGCLSRAFNSFWIMQVYVMGILYIIDIFGVGEWGSRLVNTKWHLKMLMICLLPIGFFPTYISVVPNLCIYPNEAYDIMTFCLVWYMSSIARCRELFIRKKLIYCVCFFDKDFLDPILQKS